MIMTKLQPLKFRQSFGVKKHESVLSASKMVRKNVCQADHQKLNATDRKQLPTTKKRKGKLKKTLVFHESWELDLEFALRT